MDKEILFFTVNAHEAFNFKRKFLGPGFGILGLVDIELRPALYGVFSAGHGLDHINKPFVAGRPAFFAVGAFAHGNDLSAVFGGGEMLVGDFSHERPLCLS